MSNLFFVNNCNMKRFLLAVVLIVAIIGVMLCFVPQSPYADVFNYVNRNAVVNIYCRKTTCAAIDIGLGYQATCSVSDFKETLSYCEYVDGVSVSFAGTVEDLYAIAERLQAELVSVQQLDELIVVCYSTHRLHGGVTLDGKNVNLQVAYRDGTVTVGYPLILGSY